MAAPTYPQLLEEALELGRLDGALSAALEVPVFDLPTGDRCLGRTPAEFARFLWQGQPGNPPSGLEVNAPLWYAAGFAEGLAVPEIRPCDALIPRRPVGRSPDRVDLARRQGRVVHRWAGAAPAD